MAENMTRSELDYSDHPFLDVTVEAQNTVSSALNEQNKSTPIIWTPRFIVIFFLLLVIGLSLASILTQGWLNGYFSAEKILLIFTVLVFTSWFAIIVRACSSWVRFGAAFGLLWTIFTALNFVNGLIAIDPNASIIAHLNAVTNLSLLATYLCLSVARTPLQRWDHWFFRVAPIIGGGAVVILFLLTPADARSFSSLESNIAAIALYLGIAVWWLRPSCWKQQPGPAFCFGIAPAILLILAIPHFANPVSNLFFLQVTMLCFLLTTLRILQGELRH